MPTSRGRVLIVDDEANARTALAELLRDDGFVTETAADGFKALGKLGDFQPDVILTDVKMPGLDGIGLMERAKEATPDAVVIVMTAYGTITSAVDAVKRGAENYLAKPLDDAESLIAIVGKGVEKSRLLQETRRLRDRLRERNVFGHIVGDHPAMKQLLELIAQVAPSRASVLVSGESGTGKELVAEAIHRGSPRDGKPLVRLNCAALAESLLESELFGHERGAFTGAVARREGRFKQADGGTLFLDEVSEIPLPLQVKLLRFLQTRELERVGGNETLKLDVRVIAASNRDLREQIRLGRFREDLFYRLNVVAIEIPPLRARATDIPQLATFFLRRYAQENGKTIDGFSDDAIDALTRYPWPGNVRELENAIERAVVLGNGAQITRRQLPTTVAPENDRAAMPPVPGATIYDIERWAILKTLESTGGSTSKAATVLGISARKIQYKLHEYQSGARVRESAREDDEPLAFGPMGDGTDAGNDGGNGARR